MCLPQPARRGRDRGPSPKQGSLRSLVSSPFYAKSGGATRAEDRILCSCSRPAQLCPVTVQWSHSGSQREGTARRRRRDPQPRSRGVATRNAMHTRFGFVCLDLGCPLCVGFVGSCVASLSVRCDVTPSVRYPTDRKNSVFEYRRKKSVTRACNKLSDTCARRRWRLTERTEH